MAQETSPTVAAAKELGKAESKLKKLQDGLQASITKAVESATAKAKARAQAKIDAASKAVVDAKAAVLAAVQQ